MPASTKTKIQLAFKSGGLCAFQDCRVVLVAGDKTKAKETIGEAAHIYREKDGSARYVAEMSETERNHCDNLIYLCPTCHTKIDKLVDDYPADYLLKIKQDHEKWVSDSLDDSMSEFAFAELEVAVKAISSGQRFTNDDFRVITPTEKIEKNELSNQVKSLISMGISRSSEVRDYLLEYSRIDSKFPERLKGGFKDEYLKLKKEMKGDDLFYAMLDFAQKGSVKINAQYAASLAILCYLFEICEIFEK